MPEPADFGSSTSGVDPEVSRQAGPQLVVPADERAVRAQAANARWGSLYDALYGTDVIGETGRRRRGRGYNPVRGAKVDRLRPGFLDESRR